MVAPAWTVAAAVAAPELHFGHKPDRHAICSAPNEVRLWLSVNACNLGNLWLRLAIEHAWYYGLRLAETRLMQGIRGSILRRTAAPPLPAGLGGGRGDE